MEITGWRGEWGGSRWWARLFSYSAILGVSFGVAGPFGSFFNASVLVRVLHWTGMMLLGGAVSGLCIPPLVRLGLRLRLPRLFSLVAAVMLAAAPLSIVAALITRTYWGRETHSLGPADWYGQTLMIQAASVALWVLLELALRALPGRSQPVHPASSPSDAAAPHGGGVIFLQMEDHYVRVRRSGGSTLELMPLAEAISKYGGDGFLVHRSWWVARGAVTGAEREGRNWRLRLVDGTMAPVARNRIAHVRAAGLLGEETQAVDG